MSWQRTGLMLRQLGAVTQQWMHGRTGAVALNHGAVGHQAIGLFDRAGMPGETGIGDPMHQHLQTGIQIGHGGMVNYLLDIVSVQENLKIAIKRNFLVKMDLDKENHTGLLSKKRKVMVWR